MATVHQFMLSVCLQPFTGASGLGVKGCLDTHILALRFGFVLCECTVYLARVLIPGSWFYTGGDRGLFKLQRAAFFPVPLIRVE